MGPELSDTATAHARLAVSPARPRTTTADARKLAVRPVTQGTLAPLGLGQERVFWCRLAATERPATRRDHADRRDEERVDLQLQMLHRTSPFGHFGQV